MICGQILLALYLYFFIIKIDLLILYFHYLRRLIKNKFNCEFIKNDFILFKRDAKILSPKFVSYYALSKLIRYNLTT